MRRKTNIKINKHNRVGVPVYKIEFVEGQYITFFNGKKDLYLCVDKVRINPMDQSIEYVLGARTGDLPFSVVAKPNQIKQSKYFNG